MDAELGEKTEERQLDKPYPNPSHHAGRDARKYHQKFCLSGRLIPSRRTAGQALVGNIWTQLISD